MEIGGYICPKCGSENSETFIETLEQYCLDCKYEWLLDKVIADDLLKGRNR